MPHQLASQSTDSFRELLVGSGGSLVVATYEANQLVLVRGQEQVVNTHFVGFDKPMGIAWKPGELSVGGTTRIVTFRNLHAVAAKYDESGRSDACYMARQAHTTGDVDIHEMGYDRDGALWFVNTRMSCLCTRSIEFNFVPQWRPPFISAYELSDRCHLNGLGFRDGRPRYASLLGASDSAGGWRRDKVSGGLVMDVRSNQTLASNLCMPHSPRWHRGHLWCLCSGAGQLVRIGAGRAETVAEVPGFARGLDFIGRYALIGLSQVRESASFAGLPITRRTDERKCGIWVVDTETGDIVGFFEFVGGVREISDLRVVPHRFPALLEADDPLLATSFELPDEVLSNLPPRDPRQDALDAATRAHLNGRLEEAIDAYRAILRDHPDASQASQRLGLCLVDARRWEEAMVQLEQVVADEPDNAEAMNSLGLAHFKLGRLEVAREWFEKAIATDRQFALAHFNRGIVLLKRGDYAAAWPEYDWRWETPRFVPFQCDKPQWRGEDISDRRLLVHSEQGNGDHIQYMRFLPMVADRCAELIYVGPEKLAPLVAELPGVAESRVPGQIPGDRFDLYCPLMSLPRWLGITLENLPAPERYLRIPPQVVVRQLTGAFKVGLSWAGSPTWQDDALRSMPLSALVPLLEVEGIDFYSLQMPLSGAELRLLGEHGVTNLEPELPGYARTAALVDQLDLVISVDTAIGHLAAALGKPTWVMLSTEPDWRWMDEREDTPWYPTMRLIRQTEPGDWETVVRRVREMLAERVRAER